MAFKEGLDLLDILVRHMGHHQDVAAIAQGALKETGFMLGNARTDQPANEAPGRSTDHTAAEDANQRTRRQQPQAGDRSHMELSRT